MKKKYRKPSDITVGVVGYGGAFNMGRQHLLEMQKAGMTPVAVAEVDPARLRVAGEDFPGIGLFSSLGEMLKNSPVGLVVIITPHNTHAPLALKCLRAGRHVVCEKPLAITTAETESMIRAARKSGVMLSTYHNRHWDGHILQAVELVHQKKALGDVFRIDCHMGGYSKPRDWWRTSRSISGGILFDWGVHLLEYSFQLIQSPLREVSGFFHEGYWAPKTAWKGDTIEDDGFVVVRFEGGQRLTLSISHLGFQKYPGWMTITGTEGSLMIGGTPTTLTTHRKNCETTTRFPNRPSEGWRYYANVAAHLTGREDLVITAAWSQRPIHVLDLAIQSAKQGRALRVKYT